MEVQVLRFGKVELEDLDELINEHINLSDTVSWYITTLGQKLQKLQAENEQLKLSNICIPCPDDDCCGVLTTEKYIDRPTCNECGKVYVLEQSKP